MYIINLFVFLFTIAMHEKHVYSREEEKISTGSFTSISAFAIDKEVKYEGDASVDNAVGLMMLGSSLSLFAKFSLQSWHCGKTYWTSQWAWMDLMYACLSAIIAIMIIK